MNAFLNHWKIFSACLLVGLLTAFGVRASTSTSVEPAAASPKPEPEPEPDSTPTGLLIDLGNAECPIGDDKVDGETYAEWNSVRVGFCCPGSDARLLKDPEATLDRRGIEWRELSEATEVVIFTLST